MDNYGISMQGSFLIQKVEYKPNWTATNIGQLILELNNGQYWLGGDSIDDGETGWIPIGLIEGTVKAKYIDWDIDLTLDETKVSALNVPCFYDTTSITNVQVAINTLLDYANDIASGDLLEENSIDVSQINFTASSFLIDNDNGAFTGPFATVESALTEIVNYNASDWDLDPDSNFGENIGFDCQTIQDALDDFEDYLASLTASNLSATYAGTGVSSTLQGVLDTMHYDFTHLNFTDLIGSPDTYGTPSNYLSTTGQKCEWKSLTASNVTCTYPGTVESTVQSALHVIQGELESISVSITSVSADASNVSYDGDSYNNVDDVLDFLLAYAFTSSNPPTATNVSSSGIGGVDNVQESLEYLSSQISQIIATVPLSVEADDVAYDAASGQTNVADTLTYLYTTYTGFEDLINTKADADHTHSDLYYTHDEVDELIPANFDDYYYRKDEVDTLTSSIPKIILSTNTSPVALSESSLDVVTCEHTATSTESLAIQLAFKVTSPAEGSIIVELYKDDTTLIHNSDFQVIDTDIGKTFSIIVADSIEAGEHTFVLKLATASATTTIAVDDASILIHRISSGGE